MAAVIYKSENMVQNVVSFLWWFVLIYHVPTVLYFEIKEHLAEVIINSFSLSTNAIPYNNVHIQEKYYPQTHLLI